MGTILRKQGFNISGGGGSAGTSIEKATYEETTALHDHAVDELIILIDDGVTTLYKVTSAITEGDTITDEGQNANVTTNTGIGADVPIYVSGIVSGDNVPDGSTVTPTDDVQILLQCAGIDDKSYTTLNELLADTTTLQSVISSENAVNYLVRCKDWCGVGLVPTMTSDTTPSGVASASGVYNDYPQFQAYKAFDNDASTLWAATDNQAGNYIQYEFNTPTIIKKAILKNTNQNNAFINGKVQASNDGNSFIDIHTFTSLIISADNNLEFYDNNTAYKYWRVVSTSASSGSFLGIYGLQFYSEYNLCDNQTFMSYVGLNNYASNTLLADSDWLNAICDSTYFESVLNVKVPTMTSNTTPSGEASGSTRNTPVTDCDWYQAFDNNQSTIFQCSNGSTYGYVQYMFTRNVKIYCAYLNTSEFTRWTNYKFQSSSNNIDYTDVTDTFTASQVNMDTKILFDRNVGLAQYYRFYGAITENGPYIKTLQFYGREDV